MQNQRVKLIVRLSLFLALGVVLNIIESFIPVFVPGVKLGIANTIGLIVLYFFGIKGYVAVGFLRVVLVGLLRTGLFSSAFILSMMGFVFSCIATLILYFTRKPSIYGLSVISAIMHGIGQIVGVMIIYQSIEMINYLPIIAFSSLVSGFLLAYVCQIVIKRLKNVIK